MISTIIVKQQDRTGAALRNTIIDYKQKKKISKSMSLQSTKENKPIMDMIYYGKTR